MISRWKRAFLGGVYRLVKSGLGKMIIFVDPSDRQKKYTIKDRQIWRSFRSGVDVTEKKKIHLLRIWCWGFIGLIRKTFTIHLDDLAASVISNSTGTRFHTPMSDSYKGLQSMLVKYQKKNVTILNKINKDQKQGNAQWGHKDKKSALDKPCRSSCSCWTWTLTTNPLTNKIILMDPIEFILICPPFIPIIAWNLPLLKRLRIQLPRMCCMRRT